jgi:hypothetical protein
MASDAFIPFRGVLDVADDAGVLADVQPGGSGGADVVADAALVGGGTGALALSPAGDLLDRFAPPSGAAWRAQRSRAPRTVDSPYGSAEVTYDDYHVPHVSADTEAAAYHALGYVQAADRLFQMDLVRRRMRGTLAAAVGETYGRHPSFAVGSGHDEPTDAFADGLGDGLLDGLRLRWRAWRTDYDATPAERVVEAFPDDLPTFPVVGDPGTGAAARRLFPGWEYADAGDVEALLDRYPGDVVAEFGAGSVTAADGEPAANGSDVDGAQRAARAAGEASSGSSQTSVVETVAADLRREGVGAVVYALRDAGDGGMGVYAADGEAKPAQSALSAVFQPVQAFLESPEASRSAVVVCNDGPVALEADLYWSMGEETGNESMTVAAGERWQGGPVDLPAAAETATLEVSTDAGAVEHRYDLSE